jgi:release factor glutamine methyltransferase
VARLRAAGCVFAEDEARLITAAARSPQELDAMVDQRAAGLPLEQVLGWAEFCGLRIAVEPGVFVPRRRTEFLVQQAVLLIRGDSIPPDPPGPLIRRDSIPPDPPGPLVRKDSIPPDPPGPLVRGDSVPPETPGPLGRPGVVVVDLCCGSGAIAAAVAAAVPDAEVYAVDLDPAAVRCARRNVPGHVYQGDLYQPLPARLRGRVGILAANVPYVPTGEIGFLPPEARAHEPRVALDGGPDGLDVLRRVAAEAPDWLAPGGHLLIETSDRQVPLGAAAFAASGLTPRTATSTDLNAIVLIGTLPGPLPPPALVTP